MTTITYLKWRYVEKFDFYDVTFQLDGYANKRVYINSHRIKDLDMAFPEAFACLLRAELACDPIRGVEKSIEER